MLEHLGPARAAEAMSRWVLWAEAAWFDMTRRVRTSGCVSLDKVRLVSDGRNCNRYVPVRPAVAKRIFDKLPIRDFGDYTFVDIGSGKGRMLLIAAEYPFRRVEGVEFAVELHNQAEANIVRSRRRRRRCPSVRSLLMNAADYEFPPGSLVVYLFNPFGREVVEQVLTRLDASLREDPRDAVIVMLYPDHAAAIDRRPHFRLVNASRRCRIYRFICE